MKTNSSKLVKNLLDLIQRFYNGEKLTSKKIAELYDVNLRTAQRYPNYLKDGGMDIRKDKNQFYLKMPVGIENALEMIKQLNVSLPVINQLKTSIYYSKLDLEKVDLYKFEILEDAIKEKKQLNIIYKEFDKKESKLTNIKPLKIVNFEGFWYLLAFNYKNEYRRYHINSMINIKTLKENFDLDESILAKINENALNIWYNPFKKPYLVELFLDEVATVYIKRLNPFKRYVLKEEKDGSSIITLQITDEMEILPFILRWIPHIKVLSPKHLKQSVLNQVKQYL